MLVGSGFFQSALRALRSGGTNMDTLVSIGVLTAWSYSAVLLVLTLSGVAHEQMSYFAEAVALLGIVGIDIALINNFDYFCPGWLIDIFCTSSVNDDLRIS